MGTINCSATTSELLKDDADKSICLRKLNFCYVHNYLLSRNNNPRVNNNLPLDKEFLEICKKYEITTPPLDKDIWNVKITHK